MSNGWDESAEAWIASLGEEGDFARRFILDRPMLDRVRQSGARNGLDVGCGEGRFCRLLAREGIKTCGIDPAPALIERARQLDPEGDYRLAGAEKLPFADAGFDLVIAYLSLIDIAELEAAITEMVRVLRPGGHLLIANLTSLWSASNPDGWKTGPDGVARFEIDHYMDERVDWVGWGGVRIRNWHRPLSTYMRLMLDAGMTLKYFDEPMPYGGGPEPLAAARRVPGFLVMDWQKPE